MNCRMIDPRLLTPDEKIRQADMIEVYKARRLLAAMAALTGLLADPTPRPSKRKTGETCAQATARIAVEHADALLEGIGETEMSDRPVLDACCGSRMFWFDRKDPRAVFIDNRRETHVLPDVSSTGGNRTLTIDPDLVADFTALPFENNSFALVVFDPPHLVRNGRNGWLAKKYGKLGANWRDELRRGFAECFRVLRPDGTLIFKWNENDIPVSEVLALTPERPLIGNRCGKRALSHWIVFLKPQ